MLRNSLILAVLSMIATCVGCGSASTASVLEGAWIGRPLKATERESPAEAVRPASQAAPAEGESESSEGSDSDSAETRTTEAASAETSSTEEPSDLESSDLESFDFTVGLQFNDDGSVAMWVGDGQQSLEGTWNVISTEGRRSRLEISALVSDATSEEPQFERRRFDIKLGPDGNWFTLREEGADPQFGLLRFERRE